MYTYKKVCGRINPLLVHRRRWVYCMWKESQVLIWYPTLPITACIVNTRSNNYMSVCKYRSFLTQTIKLWNNHLAAIWKRKYYQNIIIELFLRNQQTLKHFFPFFSQFFDIVYFSNMEISQWNFKILAQWPY